MEGTRKKMSNTTYLLIVAPLCALLLALIITATSVMNYYDIVMNSVLGGPDIIIKKAEGTEDWDADYYSKKDVSTPDKLKAAQEAADAKAEALAIEAEREGIVLLKNTGSALPLAASTSSRMTVNAFGWAFYYPINGGSGAGAIGSDNLVTPEQALSDAGIDINSSLKTEYLNWTASNYASWGASAAGRPASLFGPLVNWSLPEMYGTALDTAITSSSASSNSVSLVWLGRSGGEGMDLPMEMSADKGKVRFKPNADKHYLELTNEEEEVIQKAKTVAGNDGKVVVIVNSPTPMELAELQDDPGVDAVLWIGAPGKQGYYAVGRILNGTYNPSGRLPDTYTASFLSDPAMQNFSDPNYFSSATDIAILYDTAITYDSKVAPRNIYFTNYEEGIYMGYRFYETAAQENYFTSSSLPAGVTDKYYNRDNGVVYPFGYGLSYSKFNQKITSSEFENGEFKFEVEVKNTGSKAGKDVVQIYAETPYTAGGIEKSKVVLAAFAKTDELAPDATQKLTLTVKAEDIASFDDKTEKCYVLDAGTYNFYLSSVDGTNYGSHGWAYANTSSKATFANAITSKIVYDENNPRNSEKFAHNDKGQNYTAAVSRFNDELVGNNLKTKDGSKTMSRAKLAASFPSKPAADDKIMPAALKTVLENNLYDTKEKVQKHNNADDKMPLTNQNYGISLIDLRGLSAEDPAWEKYVQQFTVAEMLVFASKSGWETAPVERLGKPRTTENDGPQCLKYGALGTTDFGKNLVAFPCEVVLAATFNTKLLKDIGTAIGEEGLYYGVNGWYAPGLNMHRTPFSGRNFEYFSEDPVLAGKLCAAEVSGAADMGLYAYVKHFVLNDQESYARKLNSGAAITIDDPSKMMEAMQNATDAMLMTWATEQTMREVYFKAFEIMFKEAKTDLKYLDSNGNIQVKENFRAATAVMTSFNCVGNTWAGGSYNLITGMLRNEWGFDGLVLTDSIRWTPYMYADQMLRAGGSACLMSYEIPIYDKDSATTVKALQKATKGMCYAVANSAAMNDIAPGSIIKYTLAPWAIGLVVAWVIVGLTLITMTVLTVLRFRDSKNNPDKYKSSK